MARLTERPGMTLDVYSGRKKTVQQQQLQKSQNVYNQNGKLTSLDHSN